MADFDFDAAVTQVGSSGGDGGLVAEFAADAGDDAETGHVTRLVDEDDFVHRLYYIVKAPDRGARGG